MLAQLALALLVQDPPPKQAPDPAKVEELIRKTNDLRAFVAVYKGRNGSETLPLHVIYRAPDEFRFEGFGVLLASRAGVLEMQVSPPNGKSFWGRLAFAEAMAEYAHAIAEAVSSEFPALAASWNPAMESGPVLDLHLSTIDEGRHDKFDFTFENLCPRPSLLGWLETIKTSTDWTLEDGEHFVMRTARGTELRVSATTGFLEWARREDDRGSASVDLESLDLAPKIESTDFELPEHAANAEDRSEAMSKTVGPTTTTTYGNEFFTWIANAVAEKKLEWNAGAREHARKVMQTLLSVRIASEERGWMSGTEKWIEAIGKSISERRSNGSLNDEVEAKLHDLREHLLENLRSAESSRPPGSSFSSKNPKLWKDFESLAEEAWTAAFTRIVHDPLVNSFDDTVERAKSGG